MTSIGRFFADIDRLFPFKVTPAQSRSMNQACIFLGFYDVHDVWHFLSSTSMFFSFMVRSNPPHSIKGPLSVSLLVLAKGSTTRPYRLRQTH